MTQTIEPPPGYELLPEGAVPRGGCGGCDEMVLISGEWRDVRGIWGHNPNRYPVARRIETPAREWIPFPPAPGGRPPEFLPDRALWVTANDGIVLVIMSMALHYRLDTGYKFLAWREREPQPEPYIPPEPEKDKRIRGWYCLAAKELVEFIDSLPPHTYPMPGMVRDLTEKCRRSADDT